MISIKKKAKVNVDFAKQLEGDSRFAEMLENEEFKVDKTADEYKARKPTAIEEASDKEENDAEKPLNLNNLFAG